MADSSPKEAATTFLCCIGTCRACDDVRDAEQAKRCPSRQHDALVPRTVSVAILIFASMALGGICGFLLGAANG